MILANGYPPPHPVTLPPHLTQFLVTWALIALMVAAVAGLGKLTRHLTTFRLDTAVNLAGATLVGATAGCAFNWLLGMPGNWQGVVAGLVFAGYYTWRSGWLPAEIAEVEAWAAPRIWRRLHPPVPYSLTDKALTELDAAAAKEDLDEVLDGLVADIEARRRDIQARAGISSEADAR